jgi:histone deacetylase 11
MNVIYDRHYNIHIGLLKYLHPFEGAKFQKIYEGLKDAPNVKISRPAEAVSMEIIDEFLSSMMRKKVRDSVFVFRALEVPRIPLVSFSFLDKKILAPMRWGVAGTLYGAEQALQNGGLYWNLSGGYHHAFQQNMEGFCIYNDVGICHQQMVKKGLLSENDKVLIIDTDAHHGNGNAYTFMENDRVTILDVYNAAIYPTSGYTRDRVDIPVPLHPGTGGKDYLQRYREALAKLDNNYRLVFVVAGTDVLATDKLGGLSLSIEDVAERERLTIQALQERHLSAVFLGGGGYSKDSAKSVIRAITVCAECE